MSRVNKITAVIGVWVLANIAAFAVIEWHERISLEQEFGLRSGMLNEFDARKMLCEDDDGDSFSVPYRLFVPNQATQQHPLPVVLYLHGAGERGNCNAKQLRSVPALLTDEPYRSTHPCFIVVPQCPPQSNWGSYRRAAGCGADSDDQILRILAEVLKDSRADASRVYVIGFSMGAFGTWELAADHSGRFAAIVPISGGVVTIHAPKLTYLPIWTVHGADDATCPVEATQELVQAIRDAGGTPRYTELQGVGHSAWRAIFSDSTEILDWLFKQRKLN